MDRDLEFNFGAISLRAPVSALIYFIAMIAFDIVVWRAAVVAVVILLCVKLHFGSRYLTMGSIALLFVGLTVWAGLIPPQDRWRDSIKSQLAEWRGPPV